MYDKQGVKKVCSFCVSDLHLITMLLPYLDSKIKGKENFITILEKDLTEQVNLVLSRLTLSDADKKNLLNIDWNGKEIYDNGAIAKEFKKMCKTDRMLNFIVNGSKEYIDVVNENLNNLFEDAKINGQVKIINCYDITKLDDDIKPILRTHDMILNTSGEKAIDEVFEGYEKRKYA